MKIGTCPICDKRPSSKMPYYTAYDVMCVKCKEGKRKLEEVYGPYCNKCGIFMPDQDGTRYICNSCMYVMVDTNKRLYPLNKTKHGKK